MKQSKLTGVISHSGGQTVLREGQTIDDHHPLVTERPDLFEGIDGEAKSQTANPAVVESTMQSGPGGGRVRKVTGQ